jgi:surface polysaccharide O-acyltransferase-like enzyme
MASLYILKRKGVYETSRPIKNNHLVIVFNSSMSSFKTENYKAKMPTIALGNNLDILDVTLSYKIPGNFITKCNKKVKSHLFWMLLKSFLRKFRKFRKAEARRKKLIRLRQLQLLRELKNKRVGVKKKILGKNVLRRYK